MRQLRADGVPVRPPPPRRPPREKRTPRPAGQPLTREVLLDLYVAQNLTLKEVAEHTGWRSAGPVRTALRREAIPMRRMTVPRRKIELTRELLQDLYVNQRLSMPTIVRVLGDLSATSIREALLREGIPIRGPRYTSTTPMPELSEALLRMMYLDQRLRVHEIAERLGYARAAVSRALREHGLVVERRRGRPRSQRRECDRETLEELYLRQDMSAAAVGREVGVSAGFVLKRLHDFAIPVRRSRWERPEESQARLDRLRKDRRVRAALIRAGVPRWREEGAAVPEDPLPAPLLETLYVDLGLAMFDIELLTGRSEGTIRAGLIAAGIAVRPRPGYRPRTATDL
jgi:transposase